jgi:hypothetical protein
MKEPMTMTTAGSTTKAAVSTSAAPTTNKAGLKVRYKGAPLTAYKLYERQNVWLPGQQLAIGNVGDYLINDTSGKAVALVPDLSAYDVIEEGIFVSTKFTADLERVLGVGAARSPVELVRAVDRLARLEIGGILVDFTPGQWDELRKKAAVQNQSVEDYLNRLVKKFTQDIWGL